MAAAKRQNKTQCEAERRAVSCTLCSVRCAAKREAKRRAVCRDVEKRLQEFLFMVHYKYYAEIHKGVPFDDAALAKLLENGFPEDTPLFEG